MASTVVTNKMQVLLEAWKPLAEEFNASSPMRRLANGDITIEHYKSVLRETFHYTRENPQLQALAAVHFRGRQRVFVKKFLQHAISEVGHDQLALNDLKALGDDVANIPFERPLPSTTALTAFAFYQIQNLNPVGYLGYLFHLEFLPTQAGGSYISMLEKLGVPSEALTFIQDHTQVDVGHNKLMGTYVEELIQTQEDLDSVIYAMRVTAKLYTDLIRGAFDQVDNPKVWGASGEERIRG